MSSRILQQALDLEEELARSELKLKNAKTREFVTLRLNERQQEKIVALENALVEALAKPIEQEKQVAVTFDRKTMFYAASKEDSIKAAHILQTYDANERRTRVVIADLRAALAASNSGAQEELLLALSRASKEVAAEEQLLGLRESLKALKAENSTLTSEANVLCKSIGDVSLELAAAKLEASQHKKAAIRLTRGINTLTDLSKGISYTNKEQQRTRESF